MGDLLNQHRKDGLRLRRFEEGPVLANVERLCLEAQHFSNKVEEIERDRRLTSEGKADAKKAAGIGFLNTVESWHKPLRDGVDGHEAQVRRTIAAKLAVQKPQDVGEQIVAALLRREVRDASRSLDAEGRRLLYMNGDAMVRTALEETVMIEVSNGIPLITPFVSADLREEALLAQARREMPGEVDQIHDLQTVRSVYEVFAGWSERLVVDHAPEAVKPTLKVSS